MGGQLSPKKGKNHLNLKKNSQNPKIKRKKKKKELTIQNLKMKLLKKKKIYLLLSPNNLMNGHKSHQKNKKKNEKDYLYFINI